MFWQKYIELCNLKGESPNAVASKVGVKSSGTVTGWKGGAMPRASIIAKLADYFGVSISELTGEQKEKPAFDEDELSEVMSIFAQLTPSRRAKLIELAHLYLADQRRNEETE